MDFVEALNIYLQIQARHDGTFEVVQSIFFESGAKREVKRFIGTKKQCESYCYRLAEIYGATRSYSL